MGNVVLSIVLCILLPLMLLFVYMDPKNRRMLLAMGTGIVACLLVYFINSGLKRLLPMEGSAYSATFVPVVEEFLKFIPIFILSSVYRQDRRDTAALAFSVGVGFCVVENYCYLISGAEKAKLLWVISRAVGTGLMHCMSAAVLGLGIFYGMKEKRIRLQCIGASFCFAVMYHGLYNLLVQSPTLQAIGLVLPLCTYLFLFIFLTHNELHKLLPEENRP